MGNASWHIGALLFAGTIGAQLHTCLCLGPYVLFSHPCAAASQGKEDKARVTESCGRRVMTTRNTDGQAYTLDEFLEYFQDRAIGTREFERAAPWHQMDQCSGPLGTRALEEENSPASRPRRKQ